MGQKVHPIGIRLGISKDWLSKWFSDSSEFPNNVYQDFLIRKNLSERLKDAATSNIQIERSSEKTTITINSGAPKANNNNDFIINLLIILPQK